MNSITENMWTWLRNDELFLSRIPRWANIVVSQPLEQFLSLQGNKSRSEVSQITVEIEESEITNSYLDFLRKQIRLNARGKEWTKILRHRYRDIEKYAGKKLIFVFVRKHNSVLTMRFCPQEEKLVHWEVY